MYKKLSYLLLSTIILISCRETPLDILFNEKTILSEHIDQYTLTDVISACDILVCDEYIILLDKKDSDNAIKIYEKQSMELLKTYGPRGRGPNELINPSTLSYNPKSKTVWVRSQPPGSFLGFKIDSTLPEKGELISGCFQPADITCGGFVFNSDTTYLLPHTDIDRSHVLQYNCDGTNKITIAKGVEDIQIENEFVRLVFYTRSAALDYERNVLYSAFWSQDIITKTSIETGEVEKFVLPNGRFSTLNSDYTDENFAVNQWLSFSTVRFKNGLLYISYRGNKKSSNNDNNYSKHILVFDKELNPLKNIVFERLISSFDVAEDGTIYIISPEDRQKIFVYKNGL